jgi:glyoxylase-like metal-dependent hydrolase (beta-lactamase superfamily II)
MRLKRCQSHSIFVLLSLILPLVSVRAAANEFSQPDRQSFPQLYQWQDTCNVFVLRDGDAALLINLGNGSVLSRLADIGVAKVEWALFTDHHRENCQGAEFLNRQITKVAVPAEERELFETPIEFRKWNPKLRDKYSVHGASYVRPPRLPIIIDQALEAGRDFTWRGYKLRCLATPGHSPGGMTFLIRSHNNTWAFSGGIMHDGAKMTNWFDTEWDYGFGEGIDVLTESVASLLAQKPTTLLPSQGPVISNAEDQLRKYGRRLTQFRGHYVRGYPVYDKSEAKRDPISKPTEVPLLNQVTPHLYKLNHTMQGKNFSIIVSDNGKGLVLDCGLFPKETLEQIVGGMRATLGLKQIDAVWISHMHGDHFLLGRVLKEQYGAKAWTLDRIVDRCEHPRRYDYAALINTYGDGFDGMKIDRPIREGEVVEWEGYQIHVDWMPGQTEFGCCLWLELDGQRIAFTGDNLFGSPSDISQDGHECVVARNSGIIEEGYLYAGRYLQELQPDLLMGGHSYVMPNPKAFIDRYTKWAEQMITVYRDLLPDRDYEYRFDPYWVSAYPYRVDFSASAHQTIQVTVRNFRSREQQHNIRLVLPKGVKADPAVLVGTVPAESRRTFPVQLTADPAALAPGLHMAPFDITLNGKTFGQMFDFLLQGSEPKNP